jgi:FlaA1/EpsC-like NDP-sugar epimerase
MTQQLGIFAGRSVLVTGAGGSIGSELCRVVMSHDAKRLVLVSLTEAGLYNINRRLEHEFRKYRDTEIVPLLGDCGDRMLMAEACAGVDTIIHAAAHKHLPICERNPVAAISNNVLGTWRLLEQAKRSDVEQFCLISSDKAVHPASVMGATKRLAELLLHDKSSEPGAKFFCVRFGNVMDSAGSVLPLWREQVAAGLPITITDERCERYFMTVADAVGLVCEALSLRPPDGTFVLDMGRPMKLLDLAMRACGDRWPWPLKSIGLRPGEKLKEELHFGGELRETGIARLLRVSEPQRAPLDLRKLAELERAVFNRDAEGSKRLLWELIA